MAVAGAVSRPVVTAKATTALAWAGVVLLPFLVLVLTGAGLVPDPTWLALSFHFYIVTATSALALVMAVFTVVAANQVRDTRVFFLSLAYLSIAGIFFVHGLTTPGFIVGDNPWVGFSARLSLLAGAFFLALGSANWGPEVQERILGQRQRVYRLLVAALVTYLILALATALAGWSASFASLDQDRLSFAIMTITLSLFGIAVARYVALHRQMKSTVITAMIVSTVFLYQAQVSMATAPNWHASWWLYHVLMLAAFCVVVGGLILQYRRNASLQGVLEGLVLRETFERFQKDYTEVIVALIAAVEARDPYTHGHSARVAELSQSIGRYLGLAGEQVLVLRKAALLHDIGKIGIPDSILHKPSSLTEAEFAVVKEHPGRGEWIIRNIPSLAEARGGIRHHHERLDGSGYPDGIAGDDISLEARIIAVADTFDAMTSARPYRKPMSPAEALRIIRQDSGTKLDASCVLALHEIVGHEDPVARRAAEALLPTG